MNESPERETELARELLEFNKERRHIKSVIGNLGGKSYSRIDTLINVIFLSVIAGLFVIEVATKWLPVLVSLEIGVLLISIKIVWMIHSHNKFYHFQFWVLNTIEFRMNDMVKRVRRIESMIDEKSGDVESRDAKG